MNGLPVDADDNVTFDKTRCGSLAVHVNRKDKRSTRLANRFGLGLNVKQRCGDNLERFAGSFYGNPLPVPGRLFSGEIQPHLSRRALKRV